MNTFFQKNKVFILGLVSSIVVILQQFVAQPTVDLKTIGLAVGVAVLSYIANQWRGQGVTILGIIGTMAGVFVQNYQGGKINWFQLILLALVALGSAVAPPPKPLSYEKSPVIEAAKDGGASGSIGINTGADPNKITKP